MNRSNNEIDDMTTATKPPRLLLETKFRAQMLQTCVIALCVIYHKVADATLKAVFVNYFAIAISKILATVTAFYPW